MPKEASWLYEDPFVVAEAKDELPDRRSRKLSAVCYDKVGQVNSCWVTRDAAFLNLNFRRKAFSRKKLFCEPVFDRESFHGYINSINSQRVEVIYKPEWHNVSCTSIKKNNLKTHMPKTFYAFSYLARLWHSTREFRILKPRVNRMWRNTGCGSSKNFRKIIAPAGAREHTANSAHCFSQL